jgi:hypothetical protein
MKKIVFAVLVSWAFMILAVPVIAGASQPYDSVVVGKSDSAYDVKAVQDAVDKGGRVLLKGTFDFGKKGKVIIKNDIEIIGETDDQGVPVTKIQGGFWTFHSPLPSKESPPDAPGPKIAVRGIHFDGAIWTPLHFAYTSGALISGNKISNVMPNEIPYKWKGGETLRWHDGAIFGTRLVTGNKLVPGAVTGTLIFENNKVDLKTDKPQMTFGHGVWFVLTWGATIQIRSNVFTNMSRNSIESIENYRDNEGRGLLIIKDNTVITPSTGIPFPSPSTPNGVLVGWFYDQSGGIDPARYSKIIVMDNYLKVQGDTSIGICTLSDGAFIASNDIVVKGGSKAKGILQYGSNGLIANNKVQGSGQCALSAMPLKTFAGSGNTFVGNNLSPFNATLAHVLLQGDNNMLVGASGTVIDKGKNNKRFE